MKWIYGPKPPKNTKQSKRAFPNISTGKAQEPPAKPKGHPVAIVMEVPKHLCPVCNNHANN